MTAGATWTIDAPISTGSFADKPMLWVDHSAASPFKDTLYVIWSEGAQAKISHKTGPSGAWSAPLIVSTDFLIGGTNGSDVKCNGSGDVFAFYPKFSDRTLLVAKSTNGGQTFATPVALATTYTTDTAAVPAHPGPDHGGTITYVSGGVFRSGAKNNVYAAWRDLSGETGCQAKSQAPGTTVASTCKTRIWFTRSLDGGATWEAKRKVADSSSLNDQFNPRLAVDEVSGVIGLMFDDTAADPGRKKADIWFQSSSNDGLTWGAAIKVTAVATDETVADANRFRYGDYNGISGVAGTFLPSWTDRRNLKEEIWTAPVLANALPQARFTFSCAALACTFDASGSTDVEGIAGYAWSFGDSANGAGVTPSHTYAATNTYTVTLTVTDTDGATASTTRKLNVIAGSPAAAEGFFTVPLCRIYDSRNSTALTSSVLRTIQITGACGIPATAKAISANVTSVSPSGAGWMTFYPGNVSSSPFADTTSSLNFDTGVFARANNVILLLSTDGTGKVNVLPFVAGSPGQVHLVIDVYGYSSEDAAPAPGAQGPLGFQVLTPCRVVDTRTSTSLSAGTARSFTFQGVCGIPAGAAAVAVNATAVWPTAAGYVVLYPSDGGLPPVSTLNFNAEPTSATANGARLRLAPTTPDLTAFYGTNNGGAGTSHLIVDAQGYFKSDAPLRYHPLTPCRAVDTRAASTGGPVLASETRAFQIKGNCGVPATAKAVAANLTAVTPAGTGFLSTYPTGTPYPGTSVLNFDPTQGTIANGVIVPLATAAYDLNVFAGSSSAHLLIDVFGYFE